MKKVNIFKNGRSRTQDENKAISYYMVLLGLNLEMLDEIKNTSFYSGKIKMLTNSLLQQLENLDREVNVVQLKAGENVAQYDDAMLTLGAATDSLSSYFSVWRKMMDKSSEIQQMFSDDFEALCRKYFV